jgi:hypothetical protein
MLTVQLLTQFGRGYRLNQEALFPHHGELPPRLQQEAGREWPFAEILRQSQRPCEQVPDESISALVREICVGPTEPGPVGSD